MAKKSFLVKTVLMSMLTAVTFSFTSCQDDILDPDMAPQTEKAMTRGAESSSYNINDHYAKKGGEYFKDFNRKEWWKQKSVFLYVGGAGSQDIEGMQYGAFYKQSGYELQYLPWSTEGGTTSYIPQAILEDLQNDKENWAARAAAGRQRGHQERQLPGLLPQVSRHPAHSDLHEARHTEHNEPHVGNIHGRRHGQPLRVRLCTA